MIQRLLRLTPLLNDFLGALFFAPAPIISTIVLLGDVLRECPEIYKLV